MRERDTAGEWLLSDDFDTRVSQGERHWPELVEAIFVMLLIGASHRHLAEAAPNTSGIVVVAIDAGRRRTTAPTVGVLRRVG